jgi:hypothetical protein
MHSCPSICRGYHDFGLHTRSEKPAGPFLGQPETHRDSVERTPGLIGQLRNDGPRRPRPRAIDRTFAFKYLDADQALAPGRRTTAAANQQEKN